ncbi:protein dopey-1-like isoform X2 [Neocloeon triangulifer]|uniref:protein dopey-1-like isoform X2 n=1 Tax=Neocloeon triangulifer TaxID=2078957 RepID=UPI00286F736B|nr:protein dopey-1-like isoform X2 [Neocloeon triangulifer]
MSASVEEEFQLMSKDPKYRSYTAAVDKALKSFEFTSEWADLISSLGKLTKVLLAHTKFQVVPKRIKIGKRLAQCLHPALPSGVHLKALECYDVILKCMGTARLSRDLFVWASGLFPLLPHAAISVRPALLSLYETHFVPLGPRLLPALPGLLCGLLPALEEGSDHFARTSGLLDLVCDAVGKDPFYACLWDVLASHSSVRLPAVSFVLGRFDRRKPFEEQSHLIGPSESLCLALQDSSVLVQRAVLDLLLLALPLDRVPKEEAAALVTAALAALLRRDASLNRRLFAWLLAADFEKHLLAAVTAALAANDEDFLRPFRLLVSLLDRPELGGKIVDQALPDILRRLYGHSDSPDKLKAASLVFGALEPDHVWRLAGALFEAAVENPSESSETVKSVGSGSPDVQEACALTLFLLRTVALDAYADTPTQHLPSLFLRVLAALSKHCEQLQPADLAAGLRLCREVLERVQPGGIGRTNDADEQTSEVSVGSEVRETDAAPDLTSAASEELDDDDSTLVELSDSLEAEALLASNTTTETTASVAPLIIFNHEENASESTSLPVFTETEETTRQHTWPEEVTHEVKQPAPLIAECLAHFQEFFVRLVSKRVVTESTDVTSAFQHLLNEDAYGPHDLEARLQECLGQSASAARFLRPGRATINSPLASARDKWPEEAFAEACRLLVELSSFPTLGTQPQEMPVTPERPPSWLQTLLVLTAGLPKPQRLRLLAASTLLDLLALLQAVPTNQETSAGTVAVVIRPPLTPQQIEFVAKRTTVFPTATKLLWEDLGASSPADHLQCATLLLRLHNALPDCDLVEDVLTSALTAEHDSQEAAEAFERFSTLWHLSREPSDTPNIRCLDRCLFKMLDNLKRSPGALRLQAQAWLQQALLRGDTGRLLEPLLMVLLAPGSARLGLRHANISHSSTVLGRQHSAAKILAVTSQDGHVVYHVSDRSNPVEARRLYAVSRLISSEDGHCITEGNIMRAAEKPLEVSVTVNPMPDGDEVEGVLQDIITAVEAQDPPAPSCAIHPLHSHFLLYCQVYDARRVLYAIDAVRGLLLAAPRSFLSSTASTGLALASGRGPALVTLLARHAQAANSGLSFSGELAPEWMASARSSMFLEAVVSSLLWYTRSFYPNLGQARLTETELTVNRQVQLAAAELLTLILTELASLARDGGRGLGQYLGDLLQRCRLPQTVLSLLLASVHRPKQEAFTEEILIFNLSGGSAVCLQRPPAHEEASQGQLLRLVLALVVLEEQAAKRAATSSAEGATAPAGHRLTYVPGLPVPQQPKFVAAVSAALKAEHSGHLHQSWTSMLTSALPYMGPALPHVVLNAASLVCTNLERVAGFYGELGPEHCCLPAQYVTTQLEALSALLHFCLLDSAAVAFQEAPKGESLAEARRSVLANMHRFVACAVRLWAAVANVSDGHVLGSPRSIRQQVAHFLGPVALHHSNAFVAAIAAVAASSGQGQEELVDLVSSIRVFLLDRLVATAAAVLKQPPQLGQSIEVSLLQFLDCYLQKAATASQLADSWSSLLSLLRDCASLAPPTPFMALDLLGSLLQRVSLDKKEAKPVQDTVAKLVETCSGLAAAGLEQTTWLRRNLAVRAEEENLDHSVAALTALASTLAPLLDVAFGSQDKDRAATLLGGVLAHVFPYLRNHSVRNVAAFRACSQLLAAVAVYQYTRRAWRREALELLLDPAFFQFEPKCMASWRTIVDSLMDAATFRELLARVGVTQGGLFTTREQEWEQRAQLLKRLAFVLLCGERDQYHRQMPDIQERLSDCLRLPQAGPTLHAQVFLCFRVLLLRMSAHHVTSLWPVVISELVQAMMHMEHQLAGDRSQLRLLSGLDAAWALDEGLSPSSGHPAWLSLQLAACKLLDLMLTVPASMLPQFTMYRWAFVADYDESLLSPGQQGPDFVPHVVRLSRLLDSHVPGSMPPMDASAGEPLLRQASIQSLHQLQGFFSALASGRRASIEANDWNPVLLEEALEIDFLEPLPAK